MLGDEGLKIKSFLIIEKAAAKLELCYDEARGAYSQAIGSPHLDASGLQLIIMKYLDPQSERAKRFMDAMERELKTPEDMFYRYVRDDDHGKPQTSFLLCSFWYAEALAIMGRLDEASRLIQRLISCTNHLGLLSEDADSVGGQWGNFPQTYSHVGLINAVFRISAKLDNPIFY
jgi:GH15 family glucan-1,4-alpha-glucosidase